MDVDKYLNDVLESQTLKDDSVEMKALQKRREEVEGLLRAKFSGSNPTIRYAGSKSKGTMIRESYDLDLTCYFQHDDAAAGQSLKEIYESVRAALATKYTVELKTSALRLKGLDGQVHGQDFHIDVIPGRFTDADKRDVNLHRSNDEKTRLKTNPDTHVSHVRDSGVLSAIRMLKYWRERNGLETKTFVLELLVIDILKGKKEIKLQTQLKHVWTEFRDRSKSLSAKDPANEQGNDLSQFLTDAVKERLRSAAEQTLKLVDAGRWEEVFGKVQGGGDAGKASALAAIIASRAPAATFKPYSDV